MKSSKVKRRLYKGAPTHRLTMQSHEEYLELLLKQCNQEYEIATKARSQGHDPRIEVEIPQAHDLAQRTQQLLDFLHPRNTFQRDEWVQELYKKYLKEDQSDYRKTIRGCIKILGRHR